MKPMMPLAALGCCALLPAAVAAAPQAAELSVIQAAEEVRNMRALIQLMGDLGSVLGSVEDRASADKAAPKAAEIVPVLVALIRESEGPAGIPDAGSSAEMRRLLPQYIIITTKVEVQLEQLKPHYCGSEALKAALAGLVAHSAG